MTDHLRQRPLMKDHPDDIPPLFWDQFYSETLPFMFPCKWAVTKVYPSSKTTFPWFSGWSSNRVKKCLISVPLLPSWRWSQISVRITAQIHTPSSASLIFWQLHASCANHKQKDFQRKVFLSFTGPTVWNSLPFEIRSLNSTPSFKHIFSRVTSYPT